ncbi:hypothetical protein [Reyranella soli]|uniref:hypothetical protein n=1 Tax=Reyranella soli TaxID=1230389 RepID=UPI0014782E5F|nr:hypothetical protein [Reyranella soli]
MRNGDAPALLNKLACDRSADLPRSAQDECMAWHRALPMRSGLHSYPNHQTHRLAGWSGSKDIAKSKPYASFAPAGRRNIGLGRSFRIAMMSALKELLASGPSDTTNGVVAGSTRHSWRSTARKNYHRS